MTVPSSICKLHSKVSNYATQMLISPGFPLKTATPWRIWGREGGEKTHKPIPPPPHTDEAHAAPTLATRDPEADVDAAAQQVELAADPGHPTGEVDLVAEAGAGGRVRAQRVQHAGDGARARLLVVKDAQRRQRQHRQEQRRRLEPGRREEGAPWHPRQSAVRVP